jgi:hypothetical protein
VKWKPAKIQLSDQVLGQIELSWRGDTAGTNGRVVRALVAEIIELRAALDEMVACVELPDGEYSRTNVAYRRAMKLLERRK